MIPRTDQREVLIFSLATGAVPDPEATEAAHQLALANYMRLLQAAVRHEQASSLREDNELADDREGDEAADVRRDAPRDGRKRNILLLKSVTEHDDRFELFLQSGDAFGSVPDFLDSATGEVREASRGAGELNAYSAHMMVRKRRRVPGSYPALLERSHLLSRSIIVPFLTRLMREQLKRIRMAPVDRYETELAGRFVYEDADGERRNFRPRLSTTVQQSYSLTESIQRNELRYIELVDDEPDEEFDSEDLRAARRTYRIELDPAANWSQEYFARALEWGRENGYKSAQVRIKRVNARKEESSGRIAIETENAAEWLFGGHETIEGFTEDLKQCASDPHPETLQKMHALMRRPALWRLHE